jgi:hypothetical protein
LRRIRRLPLARDTRDALDALTRQVRSKRSRRGKVVEASRLWDAQRDVVSVVRQRLGAMLADPRCMYCEYNEPTDVEHFWPKSEFPEKAFVWENHLLACSACNSNHKRTRFPMDGDSPLLLDPTDGVTDPLDHLQLAPTTGRYLGVTRRGEESVEVFGLQRDFLVERRRHAFARLLMDICQWVRARTDGNRTRADYVLGLLRGQPHVSVLRDFVRLVDRGDVAAVAHSMRGAGRGDSADDLESCVRHLVAYPEIRAWCDDL